MRDRRKMGKLTLEPGSSKDREQAKVSKSIPGLPTIVKTYMSKQQGATYLTKTWLT
jgi:hypothetical protein